MEPRKRKKFTDYSRKGCQECKRAHIKCDEKLPVCTRCKKRKTECNYPTNLFFQSSNSKTKTENGDSSTGQLPLKTKIVWKNKLSESGTKKEIEGCFPHSHSHLEHAAPQTRHFEILDLSFHSNMVLNKEVSKSTTSFKNIKSSLDISTSQEPDSIWWPDDGKIPNQLDQSLHMLHHSTQLTSPAQPSGHSASISESSDHGSQFSFSNIRLDDLISVEQADLNYINSLNEEHETMVYLYNEKSHPDLHKFDIPWDGGPIVYFIETIEKNDPLALESGISLNDQKIIDFVWTLTRITKFFYTFVLFPETCLMSILDLCFKLGTKSSIFQSIMTYHCSLHIVRIYNQANNPILAHLWDINIRIPAFKQCIDYLKEGLESSPNFSDSVILTFAVAIIFSGNASDESWRAHLTGCHQLLKKCTLLKKNIQCDDVFDLNALKLYDILIEWYNHTSYLASLTSLDGFYNKKIKVPSRKDGLFENSSNIAIAKNNINLMCGHCLELNVLMENMYDFFSDHAERGVKLSGLNFVYFILNENNQNNMNEIKRQGFLLLYQLKNIKNSYKYARLDISDFKMDLSMKYCNLIYIHGLELFIMYFFIGRRDKAETTLLLRDILDLIYSTPYRSSCAIICHWNIYISAVISLLIENFEVYGHFLDILKVFQLNGMDVPSIKILERLKLILFEQNYSQLLLPDGDFVIY